MNRLSKFLAATTILMSTAVLGSQANASVISQTTWGVFGTACTSSCGSITSGSTVTLTGATIGYITSAYGLKAGAVGDALTFAPSALSLSTTALEQVTWDSYTFLATSYSVTSGSGSLSFQWIGNFSDSSSAIAPGSADLTLTFTQSSPNLVTFAGTFDTPSAIPEPLSLSIMGLGVAGLAAARRRRSI